MKNKKEKWEDEMVSIVNFQMNHFDERYLKKDSWGRKVDENE